MTNEEAKQEAIKNAWGDLWKDVHEFVNIKNGWCRPAFYQPGGILFDIRERHEELKSTYDFGNNDHQWSQGNVRPKSLRGINDNNGWTRIEPDGSNLPKEKGFYKIILASGFEQNNYPFDPERLSFTWKTEITHYKPIKEEPKPIY